MRRFAEIVLVVGTVVEAVSLVVIAYVLWGWYWLMVSLPPIPPETVGRF